MAKKGVIMYYDLLEQLQDFSDESFGKIARAMIEYDKNGTLPNFEGELKIAFKFIKLSIDRNKEEYEQKCEKNRDNALKRWNANGCERIQTDAINADTDIDKDNDKDNDIDKDNDNNKNKEEKHKYGEYKNVLLKDSELEKLKQDYPEYNTPNYEYLIKFLDEYIEMKGYKAKSHYLAIKKWVVDACNEELKRNPSKLQQQQSDEYEDVSIGYIDKYGITVYASYPRKKGQTEWTEEERAKILKEVEGVKFLW